LNGDFLITVDVEDWFQVENFKQWIPFTSWSSYELRVEKNTYRILELFDSIKLNRLNKIDKNRCFSKNNEENFDNSGRNIFKSFNQASNISCQSCQGTYTPKATFFILGWLSKRLPGLVREIYAQGHEVASHGYYHKLCSQQSHEEMKKDLNDSKKLLEDIIGSPVVGYRAPSFAIDNEILKVIEDCGFYYDSSFNSFGFHDRYGRISLPQRNKKGISIKISNNFFELPISNIKIGKHVLPWGGGGYFRMIPFQIFKMGVQSVLKEKSAFLFYTHPWEIDPEQPRVDEASLLFKLRHYTNLNKAQLKLTTLFKAFNQCRFPTCSQYLKKNG